MGERAGPRTVHARISRELYVIHDHDYWWHDWVRGRGPDGEDDRVFDCAVTKLSLQQLLGARFVRPPSFPARLVHVAAVHRVEFLEPTGADLVVACDARAARRWRKAAQAYREGLRAALFRLVTDHGVHTARLPDYRVEPGLLGPRGRRSPVARPRREPSRWAARRSERAQRRFLDTTAALDADYARTREDIEAAFLAQVTAQLRQRAAEAAEAERLSRERFAARRAEFDAAVDRRIEIYQWLAFEAMWTYGEAVDRPLTVVWNCRLPAPLDVTPSGVGPLDAWDLHRGLAAWAGRSGLPTAWDPATVAWFRDASRARGALADIDSWLNTVAGPLPQPPALPSLDSG